MELDFTIRPGLDVDDRQWLEDEIHEALGPGVDRGSCGGGGMLDGSESDFHLRLETDRPAKEVADACATRIGQLEGLRGRAITLCLRLEDGREERFPLTEAPASGSSPNVHVAMQASSSPPASRFVHLLRTVIGLRILALFFWMLGSVVGASALELVLEPVCLNGLALVIFLAAGALGLWLSRRAHRRGWIDELVVRGRKSAFVLGVIFGASLQFAFR